MSVATEGTRLAWAGRFVDVDAPCSGLRMLWTGALVLLLAVARFRLRASDSLALVLAAPALIWSANVLRCAALFYVDAGILPAPGGMHDGIGLVKACRQSSDCGENAGCCPVPGMEGKACILDGCLFCK